MITKNRLFKSVLCLIIVCFFFLGLTSCGNSKCNHNWEEWVTPKEATCTEAGVMERLCKKCKIKETARIGALGHSYVLEIESAETLKTPATETETSVYYKSCVCGLVSTNEEEVFSHSHKFVLEIESEEALFSSATCNELTTYYKSCSCGAISTNAEEIFESGSPLEHIDENHDHICDRACGKNDLGEHADSANDKDHVCDYGCGVLLEACFDTENDGNHSCDACGNADISSHDYAAATCSNPATCKECGSTTGETTEHIDANYDHVCDNLCGKNDMGEHIDSQDDKDHVCDYGCGVVLENCYDSEKDNNHNCEVCDKADVSAHNYSVIASEAATCTSPSKYTYECNCGDIYEEEDGDALGHDIIGATAVERQVNGCEYVLVYTCKRSDCAQEVLGETVSHHEYIASITKAATCTEDGVKTLTCACGATKTETIEKNSTGHLWVNGDVVESVRTDRCSVCSTTKTVTVYTGTTTDSINAGDLADKEIELNDANISLDNGVIDSIGDQDITVSADKLEGDDRTDLGLSEEQLSQVGDNPIYNFTINNGSENISNFGEDNWVTITLPYELSEGEDVDSIAIWFIGDKCYNDECIDGENCVNNDHRIVSISATYNNGYVTFKTNHFSHYTVTRLTPAERCALYGHGYAHQEVVGSCTKDGYDLYVCIRCHDKKTENYKEAQGHIYTQEVHEATCTTNGYVLNKCENCNHSYKTKLIATGHVWERVEHFDATCTEDGHTTFGCVNCEDEYVIVQSKLPHNYESTTVLPTCTSDGYEQFKCQTCGYKYIDKYVPATGHNYVSGQWSWSNDNSSANLSFVCENDESHVIVLNATIETTVVNGTCSNFVKTTYVAKVTYENIVYKAEKVVEEGNPDHNFSEEWMSDEKGHWHECVCGERQDVSEHIFENETVSKVATCITEGEKIAYCICGETEVSVIPATGVHSFVNGVCEHCGKEEGYCEHKELHKESIDMGEFGACDWVLYYFTCDCGEIKEIDIENSDISCEFEMVEGKSYVDENGNECMYQKGVCAICGTEFTVTATLYIEGCTEIMISYCSFKYNEQVVIENATFEDSYTYHSNINKNTIDLSTYGACGGFVYVQECMDCHEILNIDDFRPVCNIDIYNEPETKEIIDENGNIHYVQAVECPDCELKLIADMWTEEISLCERREHMSMNICYGDVVIASMTRENYSSNHEYVYENELLGETCLEGVIVKSYCDKCGEEYTKKIEWHERTEYFELDLSEYTPCGGIISGEYCATCQTFVSIHNMNINCNMQNDIEDKLFDENGNFIGYIYTSTCVECGLEFSEKEWSIYESECEYIEYNGAFIYSNGECIFKMVDGYHNSEHQYEYQYELLGETCDEGYIVILNCTRCGLHSQWQGKGHRHSYFKLELSTIGACKGMVTGYSCDICGKITSINMGEFNSECQFDKPESVEYVDENGIKHTVMTQTCVNCSLKLVNDTWEEEINECHININYSIEIYLGDQLLVDYVQHISNISHEFEETYEMYGETCDEGYFVTRYCSKCGQTENYENWGHNEEYHKIDLKDYGLCGGFITESYCRVCDEVFGSGIEDYYCAWNYIGQNEEGHSLYQCYNCHAVKTSFNEYSEKNENCEIVVSNVFVYYMNDEEIFRYENKYFSVEHNYDYQFVMANVSCTEGYSVIETCKDCGHSNGGNFDYDNIQYHHNMYRLFEITEDLECCEEHYIFVYSCPCGSKFNVDFNYDSFTFDEEMEAYVCNECNLYIDYFEESQEEGCTAIEYKHVLITLNNEELYSFDKECYMSNHKFTNIETMFEGDMTYIANTCSKCGETKTTPIIEGYFTEHEKEFYYEFEYTPEENKVVTLFGVSNSSIYVELFMKDGNELQYIARGNEEYYGGCKITALLPAGATFIFRIYTYYRESQELYLVLDENTIDDNICNHESSNREFSILLPESKNCEDGVLVGSVDELCGCICNDFRIEHYHNVITKERIDLSELGACYGSVYVNSCACGQESYLNNDYSCAYIHTSNEYYDESGRLIHEDTRTCPNCDLRFKTSYYTEKDYENCIMTYYHTISITVGGNVVYDTEFIINETNHDYSINSSLINGVGSSCEDGVTVVYTCKDCGYKYSDTYYHHMELEKERINLAEYGSVCGGYAIYSECVCGYSGSMNLDHCLCDRGSRWCQFWIDGALTEDQLHIDGWTSVSYDSYSYVCAVTDPAERACGYEIRYAYYWLKDENSCYATKYQTWQFGYNEKTDSCLYEITFKTGRRSVYHNYVDNSEQYQEKYDCIDCGSYYYRNNYYDENGWLIKEEVIYNNTLNNGHSRYKEQIYEIVHETWGQYTSREYYKEINCYEEEIWHERNRIEEPYNGPFGEPGFRNVETYTDSQGYYSNQDSAYVNYKGYSFIIYEYSYESDYWRKYDYSYNFEECCMRQTIYSNSYGESWQNSECICIFHHSVTTKYPTCTQDGKGYTECVICGKYGHEQTFSPHDHNWVYLNDNWYYCSQCGLENDNGISGDIVMEDLTHVYGNDEYYVIGYYTRSYVKFSKYISLLLEDGAEIIIPSEIEFVEFEGLRGYAFSKSAVAEWAAQNGYDNYEVRFSFVPVGSDGSFDYAIIFTEVIDIDTIVGNVSLRDYVAEGEYITYTISPVEDGIWGFTSSSEYDTYGELYDANGYIMISDDDSGYDGNFKIMCELKAGETYTLKVRFYNSDINGYIKLLIGTNIK